MNIINLMHHIEVLPFETPDKIRKMVQDGSKAFKELDFDKAIKLYDKARRMRGCPHDLQNWLSFIIQALKKRVKNG